MIYAVNDGQRITATPGGAAVCPSCGSPVVAKCGKIKVWHWSHSTRDCDSWSEGMTEWHASWQDLFPLEWREVVIRRGKQFHRADVLLPNGRVVEFQHSSIGVGEIREREQFYQNMIWVFDVRDAFRNDRLILRNRGTHFNFRWKHPRLSIAFARCQVYLQYGQRELLELGGMWADAPCGGWGRRLMVGSFVERLLSVKVHP